MLCTKKEFTFKSVSGLCNIHAASYKPQNISDIKAVIQIAHGMTEHLERYEAFIDVLCQNGFAVYINDHLGHGQSIASKEDLGYFGEKDGWKNFIEDCKQLLDIAKVENPGKPYIFFGHSMGSFVSRSFSYKYSKDLSGAVFCGTSGPNPAAGLGAKIAGAIGKVKGSHYLSHFIDNLAFGSYNKKFENRTKFDWLTRDEFQIDKYVADEFCGFLLTAYGYRDMFTLLQTVSTKKWFENYPKDLPVLLISGDMDPVGSYGKGVQKVHDNLKQAGKTNVTMHLYKGARHEILNDSAIFETVCNDIIKWAESVI